MIEGASGLTALAATNRPRYETSRKRLLWPNGAVAQAFSASEPESLRGPQFDAAWADEVAKWRYAEAAWDMLQFGLRLGARPRQVVTTTPRPVPIVKRLLADEATVITRAMKQAAASPICMRSFHHRRLSSPSAKSVRAPKLSKTPDTSLRHITAHPASCRIEG